MTPTQKAVMLGWKRVEWQTSRGPAVQWFKPFWTQAVAESIPGQKWRAWDCYKLKFRMAFS